ncbi:hypothetical protein AHF37_09115, partial [Paragonimus kellicotti]
PTVSVRTLYKLLHFISQNRESLRRLSVDCRLHLSDGRRDSLFVALPPLHPSFSSDSPLTNTSLNDLQTVPTSDSFDCNQSAVGWQGPVVRTHTVLIHPDGRRVQFETQNVPTVTSTACLDSEKLALTSPLFRGTKLSEACIVTLTTSDAVELFEKSTPLSIQIRPREISRIFKVQVRSVGLHHR